MGEKYCGATVLLQTLVSLVMNIVNRPLEPEIREIPLGFVFYLTAEPFNLNIKKINSPNAGIFHPVVTWLNRDFSSYPGY